MSVDAGRLRVKVGQWLAGLACLVMVAAGVALATSASQAADAGGDATVVVVRPGDTLWSIAARHSPSRDPFGTVESIRRLNDLSDHTIYAGQELLVPSGGDRGSMGRRTRPRRAAGDLAVRPAEN
jgi:hypothetical protein